LIFVAPLLVLFAGKRFPFRDPKDPAYLYASIGSYVLGIAWMIIIRKWAFGPHASVGYKVVMSILGVVPIAILMMGIEFVLNGRFHWR
jgi:hypothetical protein